MSMDYAHTMSALQQTSERGIQVATLERPDRTEWFVTVMRNEGETARDLFGRAAGALEGTGATILSQEVFGLDAGAADDLREAFGTVDWPVTWLLPHGDTPESMSGAQIWATSAPATPVIADGKTVGVTAELDGVRFCRLGGMTPFDLAVSPEEQTVALFKQMAAALEGQGMPFTDVVRTWFYNHRILDWYDEFNHGRDAFFKANGVYDALVPASSGVAGTNPEGAALTGGLIAFEPSKNLDVTMVPSPLQCPALDYGSSFSRAVEVQCGDVRRLYVSGTASIEPGGETVYLDDIDSQIGFTFEVVHAILDSRGMDWTDVTRAIAYHKRPEYVETYWKQAEEAGMPALPAVQVHNDICRDDLLFELEIDAVKVAG